MAASPEPCKGGTLLVSPLQGSTTNINLTGGVAPGWNIPPFQGFASLARETQGDARRGSLCPGLSPGAPLGLERRRRAERTTSRSSLVPSS